MITTETMEPARLSVAYDSVATLAADVADAWEYPDAIAAAFPVMPDATYLASLRCLRVNVAPSIQCDFTPRMARKRIG